MSRSAALFGSSVQTAQNRYLVEFKAGKMYLKGNIVHPDKRKGMVYIHQGDDGLMHFCWRDRRTGVVEEDLIVFPEETEYKRVAQCTTGRVFLLKFKNDKKFFLWMQEPKVDHDEELCKKVNDCLNNPPTITPGRGPRAAHGGVLAAADVQDFLGGFGGFGGYNVTQNDLLTLLSMGMGLGNLGNNETDSSTRTHSTSANTARHQAPPRTTSLTLPTGTATASAPLTPAAAQTRTVATTPAASTVTASQPAANTGSTGSSRPETGRIQLQDLRSILSSINSTVPLASGAAGQMAVPAAQMETHVDLSEVVNLEAMRGLIERPEIQVRLQEHLPTEVDTAGSTQNQIETNIRSPQFKAAVKAFGVALQSGQIAPVIAQFGLGTKVNEAAQRGDVVAFAKALEEVTAKQTPSRAQKNKNNNPEGDEGGQEPMEED